MHRRRNPAAGPDSPLCTRALSPVQDYPAEGMPDCCTPAEPPTCPYHTNWRSGGYFSDHMNWLLIWCDRNIMENSNGRLVRCESHPTARVRM